MTAYYNEHDAFAAAWLRELIADGLIAPGDVDERDIRDVNPADLRGYGQCHFFAGIAGWSHALRLAGWPDDRPVWTGSCPCQPFSAAGSGAGFADERHLWPAFFHLISECRPPIVFGEQVASADGLQWLDLVSADLELAGYAVGAADLCAAGVGAPHIRQRLYFMAHAGGQRYDRQPVCLQPGRPRQAGIEAAGGGAVSVLAHAMPAGRAEGRAGAGGGPLTGRGGARLVEHAVSAGLEGHGAAQAPDGPANGVRAAAGPTATAGTAGKLANSDHGRSQDRRPEDAGTLGAGTAGRGRADDLGATATQPGQGIARRLGHALRPERGQETEGREHVEHGANPGRQEAAGRQRVAGPLRGFWADAEWLPCRDGKLRPTQPGLFPLARRVPNRVGTLRGAGNAIVPQVAAQFIAAAMEALEATR